MFGLGTGELLFIFFVVLLIFGGKKIPEVARGLGKGLQEFRKAKNELHDSINAEADGGKTSAALVDQKSGARPPEQESARTDDAGQKDTKST